jgi:hypothetical protein
MQASVICCGVAKSGSPIERLMTSIPSRCIDFALLEMAIVADSVTPAIFTDRGFISTV